VAALYPIRAPYISYLVLAALGACGVAVLYVLDPRVPGNYPVCPFLAFTGCYCPGCGTLRALHRLLYGDFTGALGYNSLTVLSLPFLTYSLVAGALKSFQLPAPRRFFVPPHCIWALLAGVILFWVLRNVPVAPFSMLAP